MSRSSVSSDPKDIARLLTVLSMRFDIRAYRRASRVSFTPGPGCGPWQVSDWFAFVA